MKYWTEKEIDYVMHYWGMKTLYEMSKGLNRSVTAINQKAKQLELGSWKSSSNLITSNELAIAFNTTSNCVTITWIKNNGLKCSVRKLSPKKNTVLIDIADFWKWAKKHQELIHAERLEENILGQEPEWFKQKRKADVKNKYVHYWTKAEEDRLKYDLSKMCYTYDDLCEKYNVSYKMMNKKINQLGIMYRPINPNAGRYRWNDEMEERLTEMVKSGMKRKEICLTLNKSKSSIETKLIKLYGTSDFERLRNII